MYIPSNAQFNYSQFMAKSAGAGSAARQSNKTDSSFSVDVDIEIDIEVSEVESTGPQTVEDVKKEFYDYLDSLTLSPGLSNTPISVNVTDKAFEKMLADPEYKQKMKDLCARDLCDPNWTKHPPTGINITIDADCSEEYIASSWSGSDGAKNVNSEGFWTKRTKKNSSARKDAEKKAQEQKELLKFLQERADSRKRMMNTNTFSAADFFGQNAQTSDSTSTFESLMSGLSMLG